MLCRIVKKRSVATWRTLIDADALSCKVGEESITDFLVLKLAKGAAFGGYSVRSFTKHQESLNGADWELWLSGPSGSWFGYRIQAKVFNIPTLRYEHLHYTSTGGVTQAQKLISGALAVSAFPIYLLYSAWHSVPGAPAWSCGSYSQDNRLWGLSAVSAAKVSSLAPKKDLATLAPHMQPFHCLFCCGGYGGDDLPTRSHSFVHSRISKEARLLSEPPEHVLRLLQREPTEGSSEQIAASIPDDLGRVVVIAEGYS